MSTTSINSVLKLIAPTPTVPVVSAVDSNEFESYLHKAATPVTSVEKPAPTREPETSHAEALSTSEPVTTNDQEQAEISEDQSETNNSADEQSGATSEKAETNEEIDDTEDEVILSAAAVASAALQTAESVPQDTSTESESLVSANDDGDQNPKQSQSKESQELTTSAGANPADQEAEVGSELHQSSGESAPAKSQESSVEFSDTLTAEQAKQPVDQAPESSGTPHEAITSQETQLQGESDEQPVLPPEALPTSEKTKPEIDTPAQRPTPVINDTADSSVTTLNNNSATSSGGSPSSSLSASNTSAAQIVFSTSQHPETASSQVRTDPAPPTFDGGRFVQRVANAFRSAQQHEGEIQLRLSPPELGSLKIEIAVRHGVLTAKLEAESVDARRALLDNLPALRQRLAEQEIRIEKFEVDIRRDGGQGQPGTQDRQSRDGSHRGGTTARNRLATEPEISASQGPRAVLNLTPESLDVRI